MEILYKEGFNKQNLIKLTEHLTDDSLQAYLLTAKQVLPYRDLVQGHSFLPLTLILLSYMASLLY